ncbi:hypothetical protein GCM10025868_21090 [Angustibacter aerolatus]|uniref:Uncharacterized protein n=1 Tax=Angustibacter aerolatus TaxID=1162965 RepID=A0ABQ6JHL7_9ACTN|nr:hypothetical protein GCM10025868_21090 [Angustibacter aerolatus]
MSAAITVAYCEATVSVLMKPPSTWRRMSSRRSCPACAWATAVPASADSAFRSTETSRLADGDERAVGGQAGGLEWRSVSLETVCDCTRTSEAARSSCRFDTRLTEDARAGGELLDLRRLAGALELQCRHDARDHEQHDDGQCQDGEQAWS